MKSGSGVRCAGGGARVARALWRAVAVALVLAAAVLLGLRIRGIGPRDFIGRVRMLVDSRMRRATVEERIRDLDARHPEWSALAESAGGALRIVVFKRERKLILEAPGWPKVREYALTGFSGRLGPKLREGDRQIPEGVYGIEYLNPNSLFHLSLKVSYPNAADRRRAAAEERTGLGGDIMIHGGEATVGCMPIGDEAIEEVFYLVHAVGFEKVPVVIAPYDMRGGRKAELEQSDIPWYGELCDEIAAALKR